MTFEKERYQLLGMSNTPKYWSTSKKYLSKKDKSYGFFN